MQLAPTPPAPATRRTLYEEIVAVLAISLLASAAYAIVSLLTAPVKGVTVAAANPDPLFANQVLGFVFGLRRCSWWCISSVATVRGSA